MSEFASARIRRMILDTLAERRIPAPGENDGLFTSGLLDSLAATEVLVALETEHGIDLTDADFDISAINTLDGIERLVSARAKPVASGSAA